MPIPPSRWEAHWWKALSLAERLQIQQENPRGEGVAQHTEEQWEQACSRLARWQELAVFKRDITFDERLQLDSLNTQLLLALLAEDAEQLREFLPAGPGGDWLHQLEKAYEQYWAQEGPATQPVLPEIHDTVASANLQLCHCVIPLLKQAFIQFTRDLQRIEERYPLLSLDSEAIAASWFAVLIKRMGFSLVQTLVLEVNVARLEGRLHGEKPEERFQYFLRSLGQGAMLDVLAEYPVLARQLLTSIEQWLQYGCEILEHLGADWSELRRLYCEHEHDSGTLVVLEGDLGDAHRHGRSVARLDFRCGTHIRHVLYKPKSLAVDAHFQELLTWLNSCGFSPPFATMRILDKGSYGWSEYIEAGGCQLQEEIERFYQRQGAYLALLSLFEATDFHFENIIASGEQPVLIDLEAVLHPYRELWDAREHPATRVFQHSVLRVGLLPQQMYSGEDQAGVDFSGLGGNAEQMTPYPVSGWQESGTDMMRVTRQPVHINRSENRPMLCGQEVSLLHYKDQVIDGFRRMYSLLMGQKEALTSTYLPLFFHDPVRVVLRPTSMYVVLRKGSLHPNLLRDGLDRDRFLDRLFLASRPFHAREKVVRAERAALLRNDIPLFTTLPTSRDLFTDEGERLPDFFAESSAATVQRHIDELSDADLRRQIWMIEASFAGVLAGEGQYVERKDAPRLLSYPNADRTRLLNAARAIGDRLCQQAIYDGDAAGWLTLTHKYGLAWKIRGTDFSLYDGTPGIILFLAYLGETSGEPRYTHLARAALNALDEDRYPHIERVGALDGLASLLYLFTHLAVLWQEPALYVQAEALLARLDALIEQDHLFDIMSGAAGCLCTLLGYFQVSGSAHALRLAKRCGQHLVEYAQVAGAGLGWSSLLKTRPLAGFSHGAAGIAYSLYWLSDVTGEERFHTVARRALDYERGLFSANMQNWPDLRAQNQTENGEAESGDPERSRERWMVAWCHGAAGIGLGRLGIWPYEPTPEVRAEIMTACSTIVGHGATWNHGLCHGTLGNLETLLVAAYSFQDERLHKQVAAIAAQTLAEGESHGWITGVPLAVEIPGLMNGIAGIGYALLRLAHSEKVPSVLLLSPPHIVPIGKTRE